MEDRRYRQAGYKSAGSGQPRREPPPPPRPAGTLKSRPLSRCAACGVVLPITAESLTACPSCRAELHACRQCAHFDTGHRFECTQPVPQRMADKSARNECPLFSIRVTVERDTSSGSVRPDEARRGFGNLFKK
jgi:hypothetical protein